MGLRRNPKSVSDLTVIIPMCWETRYKLQEWWARAGRSTAWESGTHMTLPPCCLLAAFMTPGRLLSLLVLSLPHLSHWVTEWIRNFLFF